VNEETYWAVALSLPGLALAAATGYATGAGCYAPNMNCFSIVVPDDSVTRALFATAALLPFALPSYVPIAAAGLGLLWRRGTRALERALWLGPPLYAAVLHAACVWFAGAVLPERRVTPTTRFDFWAVALGSAYVALAAAMKPALAAFIRRRNPRWSR
jgi:hypothetical protein